MADPKTNLVWLGPVTLIVGIFLAFVLAEAYVTGSNDQSVEVGQVWLYPCDLMNPFEVVDKYTKQYKVLAVSNEYVQYTNITTGIVDSEATFYFKLGACLQGTKMTKELS